MKTKILFFALFILASAISKAQPSIEWQKSFGGTLSDVAYSIQQTTDDGFIVAGYSNSNDGDVTAHYGNTNYSDYWIMKLNNAGAIEWQKSLGGTAYERTFSIQQTTDNGYIVAGWSRSNDGDVTGNHGGSDYWIVKLNNGGDIEWQKSLGGTGDDYAHSIQQTTDNGYIVAGFSASNDGDVTGNHGGYDYWIVKLNSGGDIEWQKSLGGTVADEANSVQQTIDGGYIVAGFSVSNDGDVTGNHGLDDYWIVKLNATGDIEWQKSLGGTAIDWANLIQQTTDGAYIVAGVSYSNDGDVTGNHGNDDCWIVKLNNTGDIEWQKSLGGASYDYANSVQQTADGGYIVAGVSYSNDGDVSGNHGNDDCWIVKINSTGDIEWQKSLGGAGYDEAYSIRQTTDNGYIIAGASSSNNGDVTGNHGSSDYWIVKLSSFVSIEEQQANENSINLYPNPANEMLNVEFLILNRSKVDIKIYDLMGREQLIIDNGQLTIDNFGKHTISFNVEELISGIYFVKLQSENGIVVKSFVKE